MHRNCCSRRSPRPTATPSIVAAGDIACSPADANYNGGAGTATACHMKAHVGPGAEPESRGGHHSGRRAVQQRQADRLPDLVRPDLGTLQGHHPSQRSAITSSAPPARVATSITSVTMPHRCSRVAVATARPGTATSVGNWRIITLNTECTTNNNNCVAGSEQDLWLKSELARPMPPASARSWPSHHPKWSSSSFAATDIDPLDPGPCTTGHTDLYLVGHMHGYERFAPQNPAGQLDPAGGITEILSGARRRVLHRLPGDPAE